VVADRVAEPAAAGCRARRRLGAAPARRRVDLAAFAETTTSAHRDDLQRKLATLDRALDGKTLRALGADGAQAEWLDRPLLAGEVRGDRVVVAVARPGGEGAQVLAFVWDGRRLRFDGSFHAVGVHDASAAAAAVGAAMPARSR